jgi:hypothetical protein
VASAVGALLADPRPVGVQPADALWTAFAGAALVLVGSRSRRLPVVWLAGVAGVVGVGGDVAGGVFGVLALAGAALIAYSRYRDRMAGAAVAAVSMQALVRGPTADQAWVVPVVAALAVLPVAVSAWQMSRRRERRRATVVLAAVGALVLLGTLTAAVAGARARPHLEGAADRAELALDLLATGDVRGATDAFEGARIRFDQASESLDGPLGHLGRVVPVVAQQLEATRRVSAAGEELSTTATRVATAADWGALTADGGRVDLDQVRAAREPVEESAVALASARRTLAEVRSPWLYPPLDRELDRFSLQLEDVADQAALAAEGLDVAPALLGAEGRRRYLVALATPGESRHAGGYVGAFAVVDATDGSLAMVGDGAIGELEPSDGPAPLDLPPGWDAVYGGYDVARFPGNLSASPDWPTDADVAAQIYAASDGGGPVDGVVYADPIALAAMLELTGPVDVEDVPVPLDAANAEQFLLVDQYMLYEGSVNERRDVLGNVADAVFTALTERPLPGIRGLTDVLGPAVASGHLRVTTLEPGPEQDFLTEVGAAGRFAPSPGADLLSVRSANAQASKIDAFLERDITATVDLDPRSGTVTTTVRVVLRNTLDDLELPDYVIGDGSAVPRGDNDDLLTVFSPLELSSVQLDSDPVGVQSHVDAGVNAYTVPVVVAPGESRVVTFALSGRAPATAWSGGDYRLDVLPQPLAHPDAWTVRVLDRGREVAERAGPLLGSLQVTARPADQG